MSREKDDAYDMVDKFLRNNLDDADYAEYLEALELLYTPEPTQDEEPEKYATGLIGFIQYVPDAGMNFTLDEPDDDTYPFEPVYLHPAPRPEFVRLSEEEVSQILSLAHTPYEAICAVENRLVEKNK